MPGIGWHSQRLGNLTTAGNSEFVNGPTSSADIDEITSKSVHVPTKLGDIFGKVNCKLIFAALRH